MCVQFLSGVRPFEIPWTVARQAPLYLKFSRQEYWSGLPFPPPGNLPDPGIEPKSPALHANRRELGNLLTVILFSVFCFLWKVSA